jgi:predicted nucleic acid-binding protein
MKAAVFPDLVVDACCLINLYAAESILALLAFKLHVPAKVIQEVLYIRKPDEEDEKRLVEAAIDLTPMVNKGLLHACDLQDQAEIDLFVQLATTLDDGEAVSMAIAKRRAWRLASDDRKARRLAGQLGINVLTTAELVKAWAENTSATHAEVARVLRNIQTFARFIPHKTMPLHKWWLNAASKTAR